MKEPVPLAAVHDCILEFLRGRDDAVVFGAQAVNAHVDQPRMTQDVDIASTRAHELADEIRQRIHDEFHIAVRVRQVRDGIGLRLYQVAKPKNRHLVALRSVDVLPPHERIDGVAVVTPPEAIAGKVLACVRRRGKPKAFSDRRDLAELLLKFPHLKVEEGPVRERLVASGAGDAVFQMWHELVAEEILAEDEDDKFL